MIQENKELLLKDLCARLPYNVVVDYAYNAFDVHNGNYIKHGSKYILKCHLLDVFMSPRQNENGEYIKPYLRPMSSMTEEEYDMVEEILGDKCIFDFMGNGDIVLKQGQFSQNKLAELYDYYNSIHVDYRGLIPKGLAIEVTESNNPYKSEIIGKYIDKAKVIEETRG